MMKLYRYWLERLDDDGDPYVTCHVVSATNAGEALGFALEDARDTFGEFVVHISLLEAPKDGRGQWAIKGTEKFVVEVRDEDEWSYRILEQEVVDSGVDDVPG